MAQDFGPGAIDHITVAGPMAAQFDVAIKAPGATGSIYFGSDHAPVLSGVAMTENANLMSTRSDVDAIRARDEKLKRLVREVRERLDLIEQMASQNTR